MRRIHQHIRMSVPRHISVKIPRVQNCRQFAPSVLPIRSGIRVDFIQAGEFGVRGCRGVQIAALVADADYVAILCRFLHERE